MQWEGGLWSKASGVMAALGEMVAGIVPNKERPKWLKAGVYRDILYLAQELMPLDNLDDDDGIFRTPRWDDSLSRDGQSVFELSRITRLQIHGM